MKRFDEHRCPLIQSREIPRLASPRFAMCFLEATRHFGDWDGTEKGLPAAVAKSFPPMQAENRQDLLALRQLRRQPIDPTGLTLERAAILKFLCDAYLIQRFEQMARNAAPTSLAEPLQPSP